MPRSSSLSTVAPGGLALFAAFTWRYRYEKRRALHTLRLGSRVAETSAGAVEYAMRGEGLPLLALHGAGGGYEQGLAVGALLDSASFQTIAISRPGYRRTLLTIGATLHEQAHAIAALLDTLQLERVVVAALSAGRLAALQFALEAEAQPVHPCLFGVISLIPGPIHLAGDQGDLVGECRRDVH